MNIFDHWIEAEYEGAARIGSRQSGFQSHSTHGAGRREAVEPPRATIERFPLMKVLAANPGMLRVKPSASLFLSRYMGRFPVRRHGENLILHSHLPPLTSKAYARFVEHHLVARRGGPSHAQVGLTNACPQNCEYCYNKQRRGVCMDTPTILRVIDDLREAGVAWLGFTGGEPLLNRDIVDITAYAAKDMAVKLFTTGVGLTPRLATDLAEAGLFSVAVSLDHWEAARHDASRRYHGAFDAALNAIRIFKQVPGLHVSVSSVLSREMIRTGQVETLLSFLESLGVDEAGRAKSSLRKTSGPMTRSLKTIAAGWSVSGRAHRRSADPAPDRFGPWSRAQVPRSTTSAILRVPRTSAATPRKMFMSMRSERSAPRSCPVVRQCGAPLGEIIADMRSHFPGKAVLCQQELPPVSGRGLAARLSG
jgi:sulfatase maturation enzyme AslB (radical SAM superfamily)